MSGTQQVGGRLPLAAFQTFLDYRVITNNKKGEPLKILLCLTWALTDSNRRPSACKADALNQLS